MGPSQRGIKKPNTNSIFHWNFVLKSTKYKNATNKNTAMHG